MRGIVTQPRDVIYVKRIFLLQAMKAILKWKLDSGQMTEDLGGGGGDLVRVPPPPSQQQKVRCSGLLLGQ